MHDYLIESEKSFFFDYKLVVAKEKGVFSHLPLVPLKIGKDNAIWIRDTETVRLNDGKVPPLISKDAISMIISGGTTAAENLVRTFTSKNIVLVHKPVR